MTAFVSLISRVLFVLAFGLAGVAIWEKLANIAGMTLLRIYSPSRLLELAVVSLLFVIALQLRELKSSGGR